MMKRYLQFLAFILSAIVATNLHAQASFAIYGTAGTEKSGLPTSGWKLGGTFGFYYGLYHIGPLDISADARGDLSHDINSGFLGPRVAVKIPVLPLKPYGEFIFGVSTYAPPPPPQRLRLPLRRRPRHHHLSPPRLARRRLQLRRQHAPATATTPRPSPVASSFAFSFNGDRPHARNGYHSRR